MSNEKTLKQENLKYVQIYTFLIISVFWWLTQGLSIRELMDLANTQNDWIEQLLSTAFFTTISYILIIILSGFLSSEAKYILVFWRLKHVLPGHRAFSELIVQDSRINTEILIKKYGQLPQDPKIQNQLWYRIYKEHEMDRIVLESQKSFLLMREITAITVLLIPVLAMISLLIKTDWKIFIYYILFLSIISCFTATAGRNYGERLVLNVMAVASIQ